MKKNIIIIILSVVLFVTAAFALSFLKIEIPVSSGTGVTVYEQTGEIEDYDFSLLDLVNDSGGKVFSNADEEFKVASNGQSLKISCFRDQHYSGVQTGNNIVAVSLNGVPGYPNGIWASEIKSYKMGYNGIEESRFNALGSVMAEGPYANSKCTYLGDQQSEIELGFQLPFYQALKVRLKI